jgi:hypothetical protein
VVVLVNVLCLYSLAKFKTTIVLVDEKRMRISALASASRPALRPTEPPIEREQGVHSPGGKARPGRDADL